MTRPILARIREAETRVNEMTAKLTLVHGKFLVQGAGEAVFDVPFPVWFSDEPHFTVGVVMDTDFAIEEQNFPMWSAVVTKYDVRNATDGFSGYYVGAQIGFRITGRENQQVWVNWKMEGKALRNPITPAAARYNGRETA